MASHVGAGRALEQGYRRVFVMAEGTAGWRAAGLPLEVAAHDASDCAQDTAPAASSPAAPQE